MTKINRKKLFPEQPGARTVLAPAFLSCILLLECKKNI